MAQIVVTNEPPAGWPHCPGCGYPAALVLSARQAMCGVDPCRVLLWDPTAPDPMANAREVSVRTFGLSDDQADDVR